jgi:glycosyltransferase involved in cell wall biosynthesis
MAFGRPVAVLRAAGFLETVLEGETGVYFDHQTPSEVARAVRALSGENLDAKHIAAHAERFDERHFAEALHRLADEMLA